MQIERLRPGDEARARETFAVMADVFEEPHEALSDAYVADLLARPDFWALAAVADGKVVGGITAHVLPMTRAARRELFLYDLAVRPENQRRGVGRALVEGLLALAAADGIDVAFAPADDEDEHALAFYRALGGDAAPVTIFTFDASGGPSRVSVQEHTDGE